LAIPAQRTRQTRHESSCRSNYISTQVSRYSFSVIVNGTPSPKQHRTCGLPQGSPLSLPLFNRFINSLLETLNWQNTPSFSFVLFFPDDGVLISPTFAKAQNLLNMASHWADEHGMALNRAQYGYLVTHSASQLPVLIRPPLLLKQQSIPLVKSYMYLGHHFSTKGIDFLAQGYLLCHPVKPLLGAMRWFSNTWCPKIRYHIMKSILLPTLEYSLPLMYAQFLQDRKAPSWQLLNTAYNTYLQWIAGGQANRPQGTSHLLGLLSFKDCAQYLHTRFYLHLISMDSRNPLPSILNCKGWYPKS